MLLASMTTNVIIFVARVIQPSFLRLKRETWDDIFRGLVWPLNLHESNMMNATRFTHSNPWTSGELDNLIPTDFLVSK